MRKKKELCGFFRTRNFVPHGRRGIFFCLVAVFSLSCGFSESLFNFAEFKFASTFTLPTEETEKEKAVAGNAGLRLSFRDVDARGYVTLPKTEFKAIEETENFSEKLDLLNEWRYGVGIFLFKKTVPTAIKIGQNSYAKSVSKMKNPAPSTTINPLAKSFAFSTGIGASLPTLTSSIQPISYAISAQTDEKVLPVQVGAEGFVTEEKEKVASLSAKYAISRSVSVQSVFSLGHFYIENNTAVLKKNNALFKPDFFYSGLAELGFSSPLVKVNAYSGIQQSPYKKDSWWFKVDGRTSLGLLLLNASYFAIPSTKDSPKVAPLIGGSSSICRTVEQASINPQILFLFDDKNASSVRVGFSALENWKVTSTNTPVQLNTAKFRSGILYENRVFSARFDWTHANILLEGEPPIKSATPEEYQSFALSSSYAGKFAKYSLSGSYANYPPLTEKSALKELYSADVKIAVPKLGITTQAGIDVTYKDGERTAGEFDASISYTMRKKYVRTSVKLGLCMPF
mgnify:FL=1